MTHTEIIKSIFHMYSKGDISGVMEHFAEEIEWLEPGDPEQISFSGLFKGKAAIMKMLLIESRELNMLYFMPKLFLEDDNHVAVFGSDSATVKRTRKTYTTDFVMLYTFKDQKIIKVQVYMDTLAIATAFSSNSA